MKVNTNISNVIDGNADKSKYDAEVKMISALMRLHQIKSISN